MEFAAEVEKAEVESRRMEFAAEVEKAPQGLILDRSSRKGKTLRVLETLRVLMCGHPAAASIVSFFIVRLSLLPFGPAHVIISMSLYAAKYNSHHRCGTGNERDETNWRFDPVSFLSCCPDEGGRAR
jgi:hypothetical protein